MTHIPGSLLSLQKGIVNNLEKPGRMGACWGIQGRLLFKQHFWHLIPKYHIGENKKPCELLGNIMRPEWLAAEMKDCRHGVHVYLALVVWCWQWSTSPGSISSKICAWAEVSATWNPPSVHPDLDPFLWRQAPCRHPPPSHPPEENQKHTPKVATINK